MIDITPLKLKWSRFSESLKQKYDALEPSKRKYLRTTATVGLLLLTLLVLSALSGCYPDQIVRQKPEPYPLPPANLMRKPLNTDLVPPPLLPPKNAKQGLTTQ